MISSGVVSGIATAILFAAFIGLCIWAFSPRQKRRWAESAALPFLDDEGARRDAAAGEGSRHE
jgi:cytochrome c oxidase cbb3-type subunit 4